MYGVGKTVGHVNSIPNFSLEFPEILSRMLYYMLSLTECVWEVRNNALWDTHLHALLGCNIVCGEKLDH